MPIGCEDEHKHLLVMNFIHQPMFFVDSAAPLSTAVSRKRFGLACSCLWMIH